MDGPRLVAAVELASGVALEPVEACADLARPLVKLGDPTKGDSISKALALKAGRELLKEPAPRLGERLRALGRRNRIDAGADGLTGVGESLPEAARLVGHGAKPFTGLT